MAGIPVKSKAMVLPVVPPVVRLEARTVTTRQQKVEEVERFPPRVTNPLPC